MLDKKQCPKKRNAQEAGVTELPATKKRKRDLEDTEVDAEGDVIVPSEQHKKEETKPPRDAVITESTAADDGGRMVIDNDVVEEEDDVKKTHDEEHKEVFRKLSNTENTNANEEEDAMNKPSEQKEMSEIEGTTGTEKEIKAAVVKDIDDEKEEAEPDAVDEEGLFLYIY